MLSKLLSKLQDQVTINQFTYSVVVVDNDANQSARDIVTDWKQKLAIQIDYFCEPEQNIALARNKAVENAKSNFIAFIDDDEFPDDSWLFNLFKTYHTYKCDGVLGPVKPHYPNNTPKWLIKSKLCERPSHKTGTALNSDQTRTGNILLDRKLFDDRNNRFDRAFGKTGGEDIQFFRKKIATGKIFVWCNEAPAYETVVPKRWDKSFYLKKHIQMGGRSGEIVRKGPLKLKCIRFTKAIFAIVFYSLILPFSIFGGQHVFMKYILKEIYYLSWFIGFFWRPAIRFRYE